MLRGSGTRTEKGCLRAFEPGTSGMPAQSTYQ